MSTFRLSPRTPVKPNEVQLNIRLPAQLLAKLKEIARANGYKQAALVKEMVIHCLADIEEADSFAASSDRRQGE